MEMIGKKVKLVLQGERFYSGEVIDEDTTSIYIKDKFGKEVMLGRATIVSMEVTE